MQTDDSEPLMWRMVRAMRIDLATPIRDRTLPVDQVRCMLRNCAGCPDPALCRVYLDLRGDVVPEAPSLCPNARVLNALRP